jgi:CrcB protein
MYQLVFIAIGGSVGAVARYLVSKGVYMLSLGIFPYGTLAVNTIGAFLIGFLFSLFNNVVIPVHYKSMITVGFLGAFTTFSTYSLESVHLVMGGEYNSCCCYGRDLSFPFDSAPGSIKELKKEFVRQEHSML